LRTEFFCWARGLIVVIPTVDERPVNPMRNKNIEYEK
jgi:hypothetical protein